MQKRQYTPFEIELLRTDKSCTEVLFVNKNGTLGSGIPVVAHEQKAQEHQTNCKNCAGPLRYAAHKCDYCGTEYGGAPLSVQNLSMRERYRQIPENILLPPIKQYVAPPSNLLLSLGGIGLAMYLRMKR